MYYLKRFGVVQMDFFIENFEISLTLLVLPPDLGQKGPSMVVYSIKMPRMDSNCSKSIQINFVTANLGQRWGNRGCVGQNS